MIEPQERKELIAFCGLFCGDCPGFHGKIARLAGELKEELQRFHFDKMAASLSELTFFKQLKSYKECLEVLEALEDFRCSEICRKDGSAPFCAIRKCCHEKGLEGCWECDIFEDCDKLAMLYPVHGDANIKNLRQLKEKNSDEFLKGKRYWYIVGESEDIPE